MAKRRKKSRRRKALAISTLGLKGMVDLNGDMPLYQSKFQESDMAWLANEYQRRSSSEPSLTLENFAAEYGILADELRSHVPDLSRKVDRSITLWHGTTRSRADAIIEQGFRRKKARNRRQIFFAGKPDMAQGVAEMRARQEDDEPAVIICCIDLSQYQDFERRGNAVYAFRHDCIASDVITGISCLQKKTVGRSEKSKDGNTDSTYVALTFNSGCTGIAYWINSFLGMNGQNGISEDHGAVDEIKQWLDEQVAAGRFGEVPEDEILELVREHLPQYFQ